MATVKEELRRMLETLPDDATWQDVQYAIYVREKIERGIRDADEGNFVDDEEFEALMKPWLDEESKMDAGCHTGSR